MYAERAQLSRQYRVRWSIGGEPIAATVDSLCFVEEGLIDHQPVTQSPVTRLFCCVTELCSKFWSYNGNKSQ